METILNRKQARALKRKLNKSGVVIKPSYFDGKYLKQTGKLQPFAKNDKLTPNPLVNEMWNILMKQFKNNPYNIKVLDPSCGRGPFLVKAYEILFNNVYSSIDDIDHRNKLCIDSLYGFDIDKRYVKVTILQLEEIQRYYGASIILQPNVKCDDFLNIDINMKFDVIIGNPPYQNPISKTHKLWVDFLLKATEFSTGYIAFVTPSLLFLGDSNRISSLRDSIINNTTDINFNINQYFPGVGEDICSYIINKNQKIDYIQTILKDGTYLSQYPKDTLISKSDDILINSILHKVKNSKHERLDLKSDISVADGYNTVKNLIASGKIKKDKTKEFNNEFIHSGSQKYYCNFNSKFGNGYKVVINFSSSYSKMFITTGVIGKQVESILVDTLEDGNNLIKTLNSKLFRFYVNISKTGGFNSRIYTLPFLGFSYYTDEQLYKEFNLTQEEIDYVENTIK